MPDPTPEQISESNRRRANQELLTFERQRREGRERLLNEVGTRYRSASLDSFECYDPAQEATLRRLQKFCEDGGPFGGLLLYGPPGTGKDFLMVCAMNAVIDAGGDVRWLNGMRLWASLRDNIAADMSEAKFLRSLVGCEILALSDPLPPWGTLSQYQAAKLFEIVDERYRRELPTWLTINVATREEASERLGAAVVDRLAEGALALFCNWPSYRKRQP